MILDDTRTTIPPWPLRLGLGGLVPFVSLALTLALLPAASQPVVAPALEAYAAVIVSFLGGIRWGLATAAPQGKAAIHYAIAVIPPLLAWAALALPQTWGLAALGCLALALGGIDQDLVRAALAPPWFGRLRRLLSLGAGAALLVAAAISAARG